MAGKVTETAVVGGVDTHKDLHVAAVVDQNNKVLGTQFFSTTRQGYRQMLAWMTSFGALKRIGVECTGTYGSGLLRYLQNAGLDVLEVTAPDRMERRKRRIGDSSPASKADDGYGCFHVNSSCFMINCLYEYAWLRWYGGFPVLTRW